MSPQIECHSASKPPHGSHPTQTNCWQLEKGNTCNNDNPKAVTPPKKGNTTHATMTPQKLFLATLKGHPNQVWQICNNDNDMSDLQKLNPAKLPLPPSLIFMNAEQTLYNIAKLR